MVVQTEHNWSTGRNRKKLRSGQILVSRGAGMNFTTSMALVGASELELKQWGQLRALSDIPVNQFQQRGCHITFVLIPVSHKEIMHTKRCKTRSMRKIVSTPSYQTVHHGDPRFDTSSVLLLTLNPLQKTWFKHYSAYRSQNLLRSYHPLDAASSKVLPRYLITFLVRQNLPPYIFYFLWYLDLSYYLSAVLASFLSLCPRLHTSVICWVNPSFSAFDFSIPKLQNHSESTQN